MPSRCNGPDVVAPFGFLTGAYPVVPQFYWNHVTDEQRWKFLCCNLNNLSEYTNELAELVNQNVLDIDELQKAFEQFKAHGFEDYYEDLLRQWIVDNQKFIYETLAKQVFFGLTSDGYFCAYVPDSWSDITFDTGAVYGRSDYGRLILRFDADGSGIINNTYTYDSNNSNGDMQQTITNLQNDVSLLNKTIFTDMNVVLT